jgi:hypothetical protein
MKNIQTWQSIESAPRDSTAIIVTTTIVAPLTRLVRAEATLDECDETNTAIVTWSKEKRDWVSYSFLSPTTLSYEIVQLSFEPTHWMSLPPPP